MQQWSAAHAETIEVLLSQALTGRWVGVVGQSAAVMPNEGGVHNGDCATAEAHGFNVGEGHAMPVHTVTNVN